MKTSDRSSRQTKLPRWRGFNLTEKFKPALDGLSDETSTDCRLDRYAPYREDDFRWIADWGFDFVRLPMSYRCWTVPGRDWEMDERVLEQVDEGIEFGRRYGIHVCLNMHRAPGYCVNPPTEPLSLWKDADALAECCHYWGAFARRYRGIASDRLSFNLLNEPPKPDENMTRTDHERVVRSLTAAIREEDPARLVIVDGVRWGQETLPELADLGVAQSCRFYLPAAVSFYKATWAGGVASPEPRWPCVDGEGERWDRQRLEAHFRTWARLAEQGIGVHCGEGGCFNHTPHTVALAWFEDVLGVLTGFGIGYALWNFRGPFGVLDSQRNDVVYEDWHGHRLDRKLLDLLRRF